MEYLVWKKEYARVCPLDNLWVCELCNKLNEMEMGQELQQNDKIQDFLGLWNKQKCYGHNYYYNSTIEGIENINY